MHNCLRSSEQSKYSERDTLRSYTHNQNRKIDFSKRRHLFTENKYKNLSQLFLNTGRLRSKIYITH